MVLSEESFGPLAIHENSAELTGFIRFAGRLKVLAICLAKSYRLMRVAPERWKMPVNLRSMISRVILAKFVFRVGEFHRSTAIFACSLFLSWLMSHRAKFILPVAGVGP